MEAESNYLNHSPRTLGEVLAARYPAAAAIIALTIEENAIDLVGTPQGIAEEIMEKLYRVGINIGGPAAGIAAGDA